MKYLFSIVIIFFCILSVSAQKLKTANDSLSYALGQDMGKYLKKLDFPINQSVLNEAIKRSLEGKEALFSDSQNSNIVRSGLSRIEKERIERTKKRSADYLEENKKNKGVQFTEQGVQYQVLQEGTGLHPKLEDEVVVHYKGSLIDGTEFDNSYERGAPITLNLVHVIEGWKIGIPLMKVGGKMRFVIPYNLGYGSREVGQIPAFSTLIFEVELIKIISDEPVESI